MSSAHSQLVQCLPHEIESAKAQKLLSAVQEKTYRKGDVIYHEGEQGERIFLIKSGIVGLFYLTEQGHETLLRVFAKDHIFGHRAFIAKEPYHASSICLTETSLYAISYRDFEVLYQRNADILMGVARVLAHELRMSESRLSEFQEKNASQRIIHALVFLKLKYPGHTWTRKQIAEYAGSTLETVVRVMGQLDKKNYIIKSGRDFSIPHAEALLEYAESLAN